MVLYNYISESHVSSVHVNVSHYPRVTDTIVADTRLSSVTIMVLVHTEDHRLCTLTVLPSGLGVSSDSLTIQYDHLNRPAQGSVISYNMALYHLNQDHVRHN